ncbi:hypothetical protein HPP92_002872, partial [Vanilla planifolia]
MGGEEKELGIEEEFEELDEEFKEELKVLEDAELKEEELEKQLKELKGGGI